MRPPSLPARVLTLALLGLALLLAGAGHVHLERERPGHGGAHACQHGDPAPNGGAHACPHGHEAHDCLLCLLRGAAPPEEDGVPTCARATGAAVACVESALVPRERLRETERGPPRAG